MINYSVNQTITELQNYNQDIDEEGFVVSPLATGEELFMWSLGKEKLTFIEYLNSIELENKNFGGLLRVTEDIALKKYQEVSESLNYLNPVPIYVQNSTSS